MTPKLAYTLNGVAKSYTFSPADFASFLQEWEQDEVEYKNPFTGLKTRKQRGYYYKATISYEAVDYVLLDNLRDLFDVAITDRKFYPNILNTTEYYDVDVNDTISTEDSDVAEAARNLEITFRSKERYDSPLNQPYGYWGDRHFTFDDYEDDLFSHFN
jgi:hypothetical protein